MPNRDRIVLAAFSRCQSVQYAVCHANVALVDLESVCDPSLELCRNMIHSNSIATGISAADTGLSCQGSLPSCCATLTPLQQ